MADMSLTGFPPEIPEFTLPTSINTTYMQENDDEILGCTSAESYWWKSADTVRNFRVTTAVIQRQFTDFYNAVVNQSISKDSSIYHYFNPSRIDVPGLAERPPNPTPANIRQNTGSARCFNCANYEGLLEAVTIAYREIGQIGRRLEEASRIGIEAADRSVHELGIYDVVGALRKESAPLVPFEAGSVLPRWFQRRYPRHSEDDPYHVDNIDNQPEDGDHRKVPAEDTETGEPADDLAAVGELADIEQGEHKDNTSEEGDATDDPSEEESPSSAGTSIPEGFNPGSTDPEDDSVGHSADSESEGSGGSGDYEDSDEAGESSDDIYADDGPLGEEVDSD